MHYPNPIFGQVKPGTDLAYFPAGGHFSGDSAVPLRCHLPPGVEMVHRPDTVAYLQRVGLRQSRRQPGLRLDNGGRPVRVTRAQRRQRGGERTAGAVGILVCTRGAVNRCSPSRVKSQSGLSASSRWPPFINTAPQPSASSARPCSSISRSLRAWGHRVARPLPAGSG